MSLRSAPAALAAACPSLACLALAAAPALAVAPPRDSERTPIDLGEETGRAASGGGGGSLVRTFVGLAVVIAVIYGLHWVLKQVKASREERTTGEGLATLATLPLGPGRALHVVRAGSEIVVLGAAEHGVSAIRTYTEDEARAAGLLAEPAAAAPEPVRQRPRALVEQLRAWTVRA